MVEQDGFHDSALLIVSGDAVEKPAVFLPARRLAFPMS
jgi:hypothetical protein